MNEAQVLMTVSNFSGFFLEMISWKGASLFNGGLFVSWEGASFLSGEVPHWGASVLMGKGEFWKKL